MTTAVDVTDDATRPNFDISTRHAAARLAFGARQNMGWSRKIEDVTNDFVTSSSLLQTGQLVKDEHFTLFESVGALEIMDPKMDTGCVGPTKMVEPELRPWDTITANELLWVLDELLCLEISWLEDYPLSQTVFTSIHVDRILEPNNQYPYPLELRKHTAAESTLTNMVLQPYCLALLRCATMVLELARSQGFYEEEDFVSHTFGREIVPDLTTDDALDRLEEATTWLNGNITDTKLLAAINCRLLFRKLFLQSIFGQFNGWQDMIDLLHGGIEATRNHATQKPACFSTKVLRHLATSTPPRPPLITSWMHAKSRWQKLCHDVAAATQLTSPSIRQDPACLQQAMRVFASRQSSTLPRAIIQDILFVDGKTAEDISHFELLLADIRELVLPGHHLTDLDSFEVEAVNDPRHRGARVMESFIDSALQEYLNMYRAHCQNRARLRRELTHSIRELDIIEKQIARNSDDEIEAFALTERHNTSQGEQQRSRPLTTWIRHYKLKVMAETIQLGFETDLYLPDEIAHMYWYLSSLLTQRRHLLEHMEVFTRHRAILLHETGLPRQVSECIGSLRWYQTMMASLDAQVQLAVALQKIYTIMLCLGLIKAPTRSFAQPELCHEARMKVFLATTDPPTPTLDDFTRARTLTLPMPETISQIEACVQQARASLSSLKNVSPADARCVGTEDQWRTEVKQLETTAVAIVVASTQLKRAHAIATDSSAAPMQIDVSIPTLGKRYHSWWIVPQLKQKK